MDYDITMLEVPAQPVLSIRGQIAPAEISSFLGRSFADLYGRVGLLGAAAAGHPFVIYHHFGSEVIDAEVCVPVAVEVGASGGIESRVVEAATVARTIHVGPYEDLDAAYGALDRWVGDHHFEVAGPSRERYLNGPDEGRSPAGYRTEIDLPIAPAMVAAPV